MHTHLFPISLLLRTILPGLVAPDKDNQTMKKVDNYSPYAGRNFPTNVYWGDTHLHTGMSMDAGAFEARLTPEDAYRFARGEELTSSTGIPVKLSRPLDFLVVADHSDHMGFFPRLYAGEPEMLADPTGKKWYDMVQAGGQQVKMGDRAYESWDMTSSDYTAVWAKENTRDAIFDAMMRKETYATTGPRMLVRFFGGWEFTKEDAQNRLPADVGYVKGVPMGGDLSGMPTGKKSPTFLVAALKDPLSGNLDRIQIVKGWVDKKGERQEKVYDVVWSDAEKRKVGKDGKIPVVGNAVNVKEATWTNTIGDPELIAVWEDPEFDPDLAAVYYVRVIEIPTPRWTAYDAKRYGVTMPAEAEMITQERAYTSPIWYKPK